MTDGPVLEAAGLTVHYPVHRGPIGGRVVHALEDVTLTLHPGRIVAVVGESGSGKSTLARVLAMAQKPTAGAVRLSGQEVRLRSRRARREYAGRVQLVLQDPFSSLNPLHRVRYLLARPLMLHAGVRDKAELDRRIRALLERVALTPAERFIDAYPHELSGGQRQRVAIARALAVHPDVILGDELVSMLDVSMRLEILNLLSVLRDEERLAMLYITHDIAAARYFTDEIAVMYAGEIVEYGPSEPVTQDPAHPYTKLLISSSPDPGREPAPDGADDEEFGEPPDLIEPPAGCRFHPRCPFAMAHCRVSAPPRVDAGGGRWARCWLLVEGDPTASGGRIDLEVKPT